MRKKTTGNPGAISNNTPRYPSTRRQMHFWKQDQQVWLRWGPIPKNITVLLSIILLCSITYTSQHHQHNTSCVEWKQALEAKAGNCSRYSHYGTLRCYGGLNNIATFNERKLKHLHKIIFCGWPRTIFNPLSELQYFPKIRRLVIEYSNLEEIYNFPKTLHLQYINISWTHLSHISMRTFNCLYALKVLDLRWNQLKQLDRPLILPRFFERLYLGGNPWNCTRNFKWILVPSKSDNVIDREELMCSDRKYRDRRLIVVMKYKLVIKNECESHSELRNCSCIMHHIVPKAYIPLYTVNCTDRKLFHLPSYLPENTTTLYANDNFISDVSPLRNNMLYYHVVDVHLDNNAIESIDILEGGYWLENFRFLSLRNNKLSKIPVYALDNALQNNANVNLLLISGNPWFCTCKFALNFRGFLLKYNNILRDSKNITCTHNLGDELLETSALSITRPDVCKQIEQFNIYSLDLVNVALATLIIFILGKLAYDYYFYKIYGRVPWLVMKLP